MMPVYDYAAIRKRNKWIHREFASMYKIFARLLEIKYSTPVAIAISDEK
jgi:hypothetical protein